MMDAGWSHYKNLFDITPEINMDLAQNNIDLLDLLWNKTTGNRTPDEEKLLSQLLFETRLRFVEAKKQNSVR